MQEPSPRTSRLAIAGTLLALMLVGAGGFFIGRATHSTPPMSRTDAKTAPTKPVELPKPLTERIFSRPDLIALGNAAADAFASGTPISKLIEDAAGQRFELFLPFGCEGPAPPDSEVPLRWRYDDTTSTLRVRVEPTSWAIGDWWQTPPISLEGLEGFWISRPWSSSETCARGEANPRNADSVPAPSTSETLGIAQIVSEDTPRQLRRDGKPYESFTRMAPEAVEMAAGLRVRVRGRIASFPEGTTVHCTHRDGRNQQPVCLIAATFDEVAIENPATRETLAVWAPTVGNPSHPD